MRWCDIKEPRTWALFPELLKVISQLSDEILETNVAQRDYTVRFLLRGIIRHHVYHAGQVAVLRKAL